MSIERQNQDTLYSLQPLRAYMASRHCGNGAPIRPVLLPDILDEVSLRSGLLEWQRRKLAVTPSILIH